MTRLKLYVETSVFGFHYDMSAANRSKRLAVRKLFQQIKDGVFEGYVSGLVIAELGEAPDPYRQRFLRLLGRYGLRSLAYNEDEAARLHQKYLEARVVSTGVTIDALHIAIATVAGADVVVSCNLRHLANELVSRRFLAVNRRQGYGSSLSIRQPEEVVVYED